MLIILIVIIQRSFYVLSCFVTDITCFVMFDYVYNMSYDDDLR